MLDWQEESEQTRTTERWLMMMVFSVAAVAQDRIITRHKSEVEIQSNLISSICNDRKIRFVYERRKTYSGTIITEFTIDKKKVNLSRDPVMALLRQNFLKEVTFLRCYQDSEHFILECVARFAKRNLLDKSIKPIYSEVFFTYSDTTNIKYEIDDS